MTEFILTNLLLFLLLYLVPVHRTLPTAKSSVTRSLAQFVALATRGEQPLKLTGMLTSDSDHLLEVCFFDLYINPYSCKTIFRTVQCVTG